MSKILEEMGLYRVSSLSSRSAHRPIPDATARVEVRDDEIRSVLASFGELWHALFPRERTRLVRGLVEQVTYDPESDEVEIRFRPEGFTLVAGRQA